jgi:hypothetical protein
VGGWGRAGHAAGGPGRDAGRPGGGGQEAVEGRPQRNGTDLGQNWGSRVVVPLKFRPIITCTILWARQENITYSEGSIVPKYKVLER